MSNKQKNIFILSLKAAFPHTIPVLTGFLVLGMTYGVVMESKGYGALYSVLMSAVAFCGSMQFVAISLLTTAFNPIQAFFLSLLVNARHLFYGISMLNQYKGLGKIRYFLIYTLCDETFSISSSIQPPNNVNRKYFYFFISFLDYIYWILSTFFGSIAGQFITFDTTGIDFVLTALFVVLFLEQIKKSENRLPGFIGIFCTIIALVIFGANQVVLPAMVIILCILLLGRNQLCN